MDQNYSLLMEKYKLLLSKFVLLKEYTKEYAGCGCGLCLAHSNQKCWKYEQATDKEREKFLLVESWLIEE